MPTIHTVDLLPVSRALSARVRICSAAGQPAAPTRFLTLCFCGRCSNACMPMINVCLERLLPHAFPDLHTLSFSFTVPYLHVIPLFSHHRLSPSLSRSSFFIFFPFTTTLSFSQRAPPFSVIPCHTDPGISIIKHYHHIAIHRT